MCCANLISTREVDEEQEEERQVEDGADIEACGCVLCCVHTRESHTPEAYARQAEGSQVEEGADDQAWGCMLCCAHS